MIIFTKSAWEDYLYWQKQDRKKSQKINQLILDCVRNPEEGLGKPEPLKWELTGCWSRRIDDEHRLVYRLKDGMICVISCRFHYD